MELNKQRITAVTLNPCVDRTLTVNGLTPGGHHVAQEVQDNIGGKGIDVNVVLRHLGVPTCAVGFDFIRSGMQVSAFLKQEDIPFVSCAVDASLRVNTKIFDSAKRQMTEINCKGPSLTAREAEAFFRLLDEALPETAILAVCGSVPPGLPDSLYFDAIKKAHALGIPAVLDATGPLLREGIQAGPEVIKPNIGEMEMLLGTSLNTKKDCVRACRQLIRAGVGAVCLTLGGDGALMVDAENAWFSEGLDIPVRGVQGAGDSVVAGICAAMLKTRDKGEWLRSGVAAAHGSLLRPGTLLCLRQDYDAFLPSIPLHLIQEQEEE